MFLKQNVKKSGLQGRARSAVALTRLVSLAEAERLAHGLEHRAISAQSIDRENALLVSPFDALPM